MQNWDTLLEMSKYAGMREDLVQAGGGNTSVKISNEEMLIKASGYQLTEVSKNQGYAKVNYKVIQDFFKQHSIEEISKSDEKMLLEKCFVEGERPSIETFLHAITDSVTLHTHALAVNLLTDTKQGMDTLREIFPQAVFVKYATPGIELAKVLYKEICKINYIPQVIFLKNHGLITSGKTFTEVKKVTEEVICKIEQKLNLDFSRYSNATKIYDILCSAGINNRIVSLMKTREIYDACNSNNGIWDIAICPDALVYCGKKILYLEEDYSEVSVREFIEKYGIPGVVYYKGYFYACGSSLKKAKEIETLLCFTAEILLHSKAEDLDYLDEKEQNYLLNWDAEKYRQNLK